jgi:hypothetical protein
MSGGASWIGRSAPALMKLFAMILALLLGAPEFARAVRGEQKEWPLRERLQTLGYLTWGEDRARDKSGVVLHDEAKAAPGYNLFTNDEREVRLMDMQGQIVHRWTVPAVRKKCEFARLLEEGEVLVLCVGQAVLRLTADSQVVWEQPGNFHHDLHVLADGRILVPYAERVAHEGRPVSFDGIMELSASGSPISKWSSHESFDDLRRFHGKRHPDRKDSERPAFPEDYYHLNAVSTLPDNALGRRDERFREGNWLIGLRNVHTVMILDRKTRKPLWSWGEGHLELPHVPIMLENGHILVFDNGTRRGHSRVIELDPEHETIVWQFPSEPDESFFSKWRGSNQRLPNGNTLILESERGRAIEVTPGGEVVWEFWNPDRKKGRRRLVYRMERIAPERIPDRILVRGSPDAPDPDTRRRRAR